MAAQHAGNGYGAQVFLLHPPNGRYVLRANFWPARAISATRSSGPAAFFYDLPYDHNFPFSLAAISARPLERLLRI